MSSITAARHTGLNQDHPKYNRGRLPHVVIPEPKGAPIHGQNLQLPARRREYRPADMRGFQSGLSQESADLLRLTLDEISMDSLKVNFDPANMILYNMGDPIRAVKIIGSDIVSVHVKDATPPPEEGAWGEEVPLGMGDVGIAAFLDALGEVGYDGPLVVEREVGDQPERIKDIGGGLELHRSLVSVA